MKHYYGFVYIWHDTVKGKYIIGSHHGKVEDGYLTSTGGIHVKRIFNKRPETMKRRVLEYNYTDSFKETQKLEQKWLNKRPNIATNSKYYNLKQWATGGIDKSVNRYKPEKWIMGHKERQKKLAAEGKHNFTPEATREYAIERVKKGTHHFLESKFNKKAFKVYLNGVFLAEFDSKVDAVKAGMKAGVIDKLRKYGKYVIERGSYSKDSTEKLFTFKKNDILEYKAVINGNKDRP